MSLLRQGWASGTLGSAKSGLAAPALNLRVGPQDATAWLQAESYEITEPLNQRNQMTCTLMLPAASTFRPSIGQDLALMNLGALLFSGSIESFDESVLDEKLTNRRVLRLQGVDWNQVLDRRLAAQAYTGVSCGSIVSDLITKYLDDDGISAGHIDAGQTVPQISFNYNTIADCITQLATISGYSWNVDYYKRLHFFDRTYQVSPYTITSTNATFRQIKGTYSRDQYRNSQIIQGGTAVTASQLERTQGDGVRTAFQTAYPIDQQPFVMRNTTSTVGNGQSIAGQQQGVTAQWYWTRGSMGLNQGSTEVVLTSTEYLAVIYKGQYPLFTLLDSAAGIADRKAVEGGGGRYESVVNDGAIDTADLAFTEATALLNKYGSIKQDVQFVTTQTPVAVGDLLTINVPEVGVVDNFLVTEVRTKNYRLADRELSVSATNGQFRGDFTEFFRLLSRGNNPAPAFNAAAAVNQPVTLTDQVAFVDPLTAATSGGTGGNFWGPALVGRNEWST